MLAVFLLTQFCQNLWSLAISTIGQQGPPWPFPGQLTSSPASGEIVQCPQATQLISSNVAQSPQSTFLTEDLLISASFTIWTD